MVERESQQKSHNNLCGHTEEGKERRMSDGLPEACVRECLGVIREPDEGLAAPRHAQVVDVERIPDRPEQREERDQRNRAQHR